MGRQPFWIHCSRAALLLLLSMAVGCGSPPPAEAPRPNVVFVVIDTLRADRLGAYGYSRDTSPFMDGLAADGTLFENMDAQSSWTAPAMASIWTSRYPAESGVAAQAGPDGLRMIDRHSASSLSEELPTLAELAQAEGYLTIAAIANTWASDHVGLLRGFRVWSRAGGPAAVVIGKALSVIRQSRLEQPQPFFAYLHLIDVHEPTAPPEPFQSRFPTTDGKPHLKRHSRWQFGEDRELDSEEFLAFRSHKAALYDGAIAYIDAMLAEFMQKLDEMGLADNTLVVVTSDHGEEFWDSPEFDVKYGHHPKQEGSVGHGHSMLAELLDVPLILHGPGVPTARPTQQVSHIDIAPTVLGLLGIPAPDEMLGVDLLAGLRDGSLEDRPVFSEDMAYGYDAKALQEGGYKYIRYIDHPQQPAFLFDLRQDPEERTSLIEREPALAESYERRLSELMLRHPSREGGVAVASPEELERLKALGYLD